MGDDRKAIVLYDADCGVCSAFARWGRRWDRAGRLVWVGFDDARARGLTGVMTDNELAASFHVWDGTTLYHGADAIPRVLLRLAGLGWVGKLLGSSPFLFSLTGGMYGWIVRNRHRISRACRLKPDSPTRREPT